MPVGESGVALSGVVAGALELTPREIEHCGTDASPSSLCVRVLDLTNSSFLAESSDVLIAKPAKIALIVVIALVIRWLGGRAITRLVRSTVSGQSRLSARLVRLRSGVEEHAPTLAPALAPVLLDPLARERREQRATTIGSVLRSILNFVIFVVAGATILGEVGINLAPVIASAGIVGVAVGFGAQNLVKDFLSGLFMILEDQYGVGDVIDSGEASGVVEAVGLRTTRLRDVDGTVWHVRNGEILRVGNKSQGWSRALLDIEVAYTSDAAEAKQVLQQAADEVAADPAWAEDILSAPSVWGVEKLTATGVVLRLVVQTKPLRQWDVSRELRQHIMASFREAGIEVPIQQQAAFVRTGTPGRRAVSGPEADPSAAADPTAEAGARSARTPGDTASEKAPVPAGPGGSA